MASYSKLSKQYTNAVALAKHYRGLLGAANQKTKKAVQNAAKLAEKLKRIDASLGRYHRNV